MSGSTFTVACGSGAVTPLAEAAPTNVFMAGGGPQVESRRMA